LSSAVGKCKWRFGVDDAVLGAGGVAGGGGGLPARRVVETQGGLAGEIVIAVAGMADAVGAADDDVASQGIGCTECTIGCAGWAGEDSCIWVVCDLSIGNERGSRDDSESREGLHTDYCAGSMKRD